ncbi:MAG: thymidine phosphorylase [Acidobacteriota bacterium]
MTRAIDIIRAKRDGESLSRESIDAFIRGVTDGSWPDYQVSALLMAIVWRGMDARETAWLTDAMVRSGRRLDLSSIPGVKVGKHSTGGVGDKVSIILAPLAAACGVVVPKMSGRGLGHTGGTLDKLESIPGFRVALDPAEFMQILADVGCCLIGQTRDVAPADKALYALRDVTATVESHALISASVMSKKLAEGSDALVLDVKCGSGAFVRTLEEAESLATSMVSIGTSAGVRTEAFITSMDTPLGCAVGNALEIAECVVTLRGRGPRDLEEVVTVLATRMLQLAGVAAGRDDAAVQVQQAIASGAALHKFADMVARQGGDAAVVHEPGRLPQARARRTIHAQVPGYVSALEARTVGRASMLLGAGRAHVDDAVDPSAGIVIHRKPGDAVTVGDPLLDLHAADESCFDEAAALLGSAVTIVPDRPPSSPLILAWVHAEGKTRYS